MKRIVTALCIALATVAAMLFACTNDLGEGLPPSFGNSRLFATSSSPVSRILVDDDNVYVIESSSRITSCSKKGCVTPTVLAEHSPFTSSDAYRPANAMVARGKLVVGTFSGVWICATSGCPAGPTKAIDHPVTRMSLDGGRLLISGTDGVYTCNLDDCARTASNLRISTQCTSADDCALGSCVDGRCAECENTGSACGDGGVCSAQHSCVECVQDSQCAGRPGTPACELSTHRCVPCTDANAGMCSKNGLCVANQCVRCDGDYVAPVLGGALIDAATRCPTDAPRCDDAGTCRAPKGCDPTDGGVLDAAVDAASTCTPKCPGAGLQCDSFHTCRAGTCELLAPNGGPCTFSFECISGTCFAGRCGARSGDQCRADADCLPGLPCVAGICGRASGAPCQRSDECTSGKCDCGVCGGCPSASSLVKDEFDSENVVVAEGRAWHVVSGRSGHRLHACPLDQCPAGDEMHADLGFTEQVAFATSGDKLFVVSKNQTLSMCAIPCDQPPVIAAPYGSYSDSPAPFVLANRLFVFTPELVDCALDQGCGASPVPIVPDAVPESIAPSVGPADPRSRVLATDGTTWYWAPGSRAARSAGWIFSTPR